MILMEKFSESFGTQINIVARSLRLYLEKELSPYGISPSQWMLLMALGERNHQVQTEIAKMVNLDNATVTRIIDKLADLGLLKRSQDEGDRRAQIVSLTSKGRAAFRKLNLIGKKVNDVASLNLSAEERATMLRLIAVVRENLEMNNHRKEGI